MKESDRKWKKLQKRYSLLESIDTYPLRSVKVQRVDEALLRVRPSHYHWDGSLGQTDEGTSVWLMYDKLIQVRSDLKSGSNYAGSQTIQETGETVLDAIREHGLAGLRAIIVETYCLNDWPGQSYQRWSEIALHLPPKDKELLPRLIAEAEAGEETELASEILAAERG